MRRRQLQPLAALVAAAVALLGGCGGGGASKEDFQAEMVAARDRVDSGLEQVTNATSVEDLLARLRIAAAEVRSAAQDVNEADAPDGLSDEKNRFETTLRTFSDEIVSTVTTLETLEGAASSTQGLDFQGWTDVQKRLAELRRQGIRVPPLERH
jgi:uncharacterized membrane protein YdfJ with MMPL/SSD domain